MRKSLERCNKAIRRLKGNEGFSLVELIIVVAIMVALVAILAPQYFQYVEKSRKSVDLSAADSILGAAKVIAIDPENYEKIMAVDTTDFKVTWDLDDGTIDCDNDDLDDAFEAALGEIGESKSKFATDATDFEVYVRIGANNQFEFFVTGDIDDEDTWAGALKVLGIDDIPAAPGP